MGMKTLDIVRAGAGSGKTFTIQQVLGNLIERGEVRPERVMAVTFTEAAATELRERITKRLLEAGRVEDALKLSQAFISTIHGFGFRVLTEFAFEAGSSPNPRLLNDDESRALLRQATRRIDKIDFIVDELEAHGYTYQWNSKLAGADILRDDLRWTHDLLRSIDVTDTGRLAEVASATARDLADRYGSTGDAELLQRDLKTRVTELLAEDAFPQCMTHVLAASELGRSPRDALDQNFRDLSDALKPGRLEHDWALWQRLRHLYTKKPRGCQPLPPAYLNLAKAVMAAAKGIVKHPGPLRKASGQITGLLEAGYDIISDYTELKLTAGVVDYTDMLAAAEHLLRTREDVRKTLREWIDYMVVDEFQDTNPLQFSLLWLLREAGVPTLVVGDMKQAIMGFQGADPRLFEALADQHKDAVRTLDKNWRSQPGLMNFINKMGPLLFGDGYQQLTPEHVESSPDPVEFVTFAERPQYGRNLHKVRALAIGRRLLELLEERKYLVKDRETRQVRRLRGADIAILCPTRSMLSQYAEVLRNDLGISVNLREEGWLESRPVQLVLHAMAYVYNPGDRHAALYLATTELGSLSLEEGLSRLADTAADDVSGPAIGEPLLSQLDKLRQNGATRQSVYMLVADVLEALNLLDRVVEWRDSDLHRANLIHLLSLAGEFMNADHVALAQGGFHGGGVPTFLAWLERRQDLDDFQPNKKVLEEEAIELRTWHSAKGLEWPVVVAAGLQDPFSKSRALPHAYVDYESFEDLDQILPRARIRYLPKYDAPEKNLQSLDDCAADWDETSRRLLYVALTRARNKLIIEWPSYLAADSRTLWSLLRSDGQCQLDEDASVFRVISAAFPCIVRHGGSKYPEDEQPQAARQLNAGGQHQQLVEVGRRAIQPGKVPSGLTEDTVYPSRLISNVGKQHWIETRSIRYGDGLKLRKDEYGAVFGFTDAWELGSFLHRCYEILGPRPDLAGRLPELTGVEGIDMGEATLIMIRDAVLRLEEWVTTSFDPVAILREWPLLKIQDSGSILSGTADMIIETSGGVWVLDHKSDDTEDVDKQFHEHIRQIAAYVDVLVAQQTRVLGAGIHWIRRGEITWGKFTPDMVLPGA